MPVIYADCQLCGVKVRYGFGRYDLRKVRGYNLWVCKSCWTINENGWLPIHEAFLLDHLKKEGLPVPPKNRNKLLPREFWTSK
jgi:hypothetical protein